MGLPRHKFNWTLGALGSMGTGKSYKLMEQLELLRKSSIRPRIVIYDEGWNIEEEQYPMLRRYDTMQQFEDGFSTEVGGLHVIPEGTAEDAMRYTIAVSEVAMQVDGPEPSPTILYIDEMSGVSDAQSSKFQHSEILREMLSKRRHLHVGFAWGVQSPRMLHPLIAEWSTELFIFRMMGKGDSKFLIEATVPDEIVKRVPELPDREFIHYNPRDRAPKKETDK